ncbi:MAG: SDR family oxidoreductase [Chloroflexi bacterium]|nr:SDR family oxidoreductase [Chloroflexota bacterium]
MRRLLVTGASGLMGLNLALEAVGSFEVFGIAHNHSVSSGEFEVISADLLKHDAGAKIMDQVQPDWIIHCAALADLDTCEADPALAKQLNSELPGRLAGEAAQRDIRFVHISTDAVFDGQRGDYAEGDSPHPLSMYAKTKLAGEQAVVETNPLAIIARTNVIGWSLSGKRSLAEFFFNNLQAQTPVKGFKDVFFCPLLVNDLAAILLDMLEADLNGIYHVVSSDSSSKYEFGVALARKFGFDDSLITPISVEDGGLKAARSPNLTLSNAKLAQALGKPLPDVASGLDGFHRLYQQKYPQKLHEMLAVVH